MAKLRQRARQDTRLKYGGAMSALAQLLQEAGADYQTEVGNARASADAQVQAASAARPDIVNSFLSAARIGDAAQQDAAPVLQGINPQGAAAPVLAAIGRERTAHGSALGSALANALGGLTERQQQARSGEGLAVRQAGATRAATKAKVGQSIIDTKKEAGAYAVSRLDEYRDVRRQTKLTERGQNITRENALTSARTTRAGQRKTARQQRLDRTSRETESQADRAAKTAEGAANRENAKATALINKGLDPTKPKKGGGYEKLPAAKGGKRDMLTTNQQVAVVGRIKTAAAFMGPLLSKPDADRDEVKQLALGGAGPEKYSAPEVDVALDLIANGGKLGPRGAKTLRNELRVSVPGYFTRRRPVKWWEDPSLTISGQAKTVPGG